MTTRQPEQQPIQKNSLREQAAAWFLRVQQSDCSETDKKYFEAWLAENEAHRAEYQQYVQLWRNLDQLEREPEQAVYKKQRAALTWGILLAVMLGALHWLSGYEEVILTAKGERQQIYLADGTTIDVNTDTALRLALFRFTRKITIDRGEASIKISPNRFQSIEVHAGNGILRDIGTTFNVVQVVDKTTVAVFEGIVEISLNNQAKTIKQLHGGEQLSYSTHGLSEISRVEAEAVTAWHNDRIVFHDNPLDEVIRQINRYHSRPLRLGESQLSKLKVSGEFNASDRSGLIKALKTLFPLRSSELHDMTVLYSP